MRWHWLTLVLGLSLCVGCAKNVYHYGTGKARSRTPITRQTTGHTAATGNKPSANLVSVGGRRPGVDFLERVVQTPNRLLERVLPQDKSLSEPRHIREESATQLSLEYLADNGLTDVYIDVRRYEPRKQWRRMQTNPRMSPLWKYSLGTMDWMTYTLFPQRAFHIDNYSPYTNTLSLNSADPASALMQAAHTKEYRKHRWLGPYTTLQKFPLLPIVHNYQVASDVLSYSRAKRLSKFEPDLYPQAYQSVTSGTVSEVVSMAVVGGGSTPFLIPVVELAAGSAGAAAGKLAARRELARREKEDQAKQVTTEDVATTAPRKLGQELPSSKPVEVLTVPQATKVVMPASVVAPVEILKPPPLPPVPTKPGTNPSNANGK